MTLKNIFYFFSILGLLSCISIESNAMMKDDEDLSLVLGSQRKKGTLNPFAEQIFGNEVDLTHRQTFHGRATTFDIEPCALSELSHIQGDATSYRFTGTPISAAFWELFPSIKLQTAVDRREKALDPETELNENMLMPHAIRNMGRYMKEGASLEIEHMPFLSLFSFKLYQVNSYFKRHNPFHYCISPFFMESIEVRKQPNVSTKVSYWQSVLMNKIALVEWDEDYALSLVQEAVTQHHFVHQAIQNLEALLPTTEIQKRLDIEYILYKKDPKSFFTSSFLRSCSEMVAMEFAMLSQQDFIKSFLERNGFNNVEISRRNNPHNKRRNVWMISSKRNGQPIPLEDPEINS